MSHKRPGIFVSYRREDAAAEAGWLAHDIAQIFGKGQVFRDVEALRAGERFPEVLDQTLASCGVLIAVIGPTWLSTTDETGARRLDNPEDWVRLEIASGLRRQIPLIPVLVRGARRPGSEDLPDELRGLLDSQDIELRDDQHRQDYVADIIQQIKERAGIMPLGPAERLWLRVRPALPLATLTLIGGFLAGVGWGQATMPPTPAPPLAQEAQTPAERWKTYVISGQVDLPKGVEMKDIEIDVHPPDVSPRSDGTFTFPLTLRLVGEDIQGQPMIKVRSPSHSQSPSRFLETASVHLGELPPIAVDYGVKRDDGANTISIGEPIKLEWRMPSAGSSASIPQRRLDE